MLNRYPLWKNLLILVVVVIAFIYAAPNLYGDDPAVQISGANATTAINDNTINLVKQKLQAANIAYKELQQDNRNLLIRFTSNDTQLKAKELLQETLGNDYLVALNLAPTTPDWLKKINALPMKLGLDLRGGVHLLYQVDVDSILKQRVESDLNSISQSLRLEHIRYTNFSRPNPNTIAIQFRAQDMLEDGYHFLTQHYPDFTWEKNTNSLTVQGTLSEAALVSVRRDTLDQEMNTLRNRVNELGVSEAIVQQQGISRIAIDLPGILDSAQAKDIIGKAATLEFHMVDVEHDARNAQGGVIPLDTKLYYFGSTPALLYNQIILRGAAIISATSGMGEDGRPNVNVRLSGGGDPFFTKTTAENVGKPMGVLYVEDKSDVKDVNGQKVITYSKERHIISLATIQSALGNSFQIMGLSSQEEARNLALLLRAGALPATLSVIEERQIGPTLGQQNIHQGVLSVVAGFVFVVIFMAFYYGLMGVIADLALTLNLILIVAVLSLLGATLTLSGLAAMLLTVGLAVDANVLIFERIREELRNGMGIQASIHAGYERALMTIIDANVTTLIVAVILFSIGSGVVKGFAVTLTIGVITSMFTAITGTRAVVNCIYGGRPVKKISIGL